MRRSFTVELDENTRQARPRRVDELKDWEDTMNAEELLATLTPEERARAEEIARMMSAVAELVRLREAAGLTQKEMAQRLGVSHARVSQIENGRDFHFSTLQKYIAALGGTLRVEATFPHEKTVTLNLPILSETSV